MKHKHQRCFLASFFFLLILTFCLPLSCSAARISHKKIVLYVGQTKKLSVKGASGCTWDPYGYAQYSSVLSISSKGKVKAKAVGIDTVHVKIPGESELQSCTVIVRPRKNALKIKKYSSYVKIYNSRFSLKMPSSWKKYGIYIIKRTNKAEKFTTYSFHCKKNYLNGYTGTLFTIYESSGDLDITENPGYRCTLGSKNGRTYYLTEPTDVQYNYESKSCTKAYKALSKVLSQIPKRFTLR